MTNFEMYPTIADKVGMHIVPTLQAARLESHGKKTGLRRIPKPYFI